MFKPIRKTLEILSKIFCIKMENEYVNKLRESHLSFLFRGMPYVMQFEGSGKTFIKPGPLPVGTDDLVITDKFIVKHPGDWEFEAGQVEKSKFNSRKEFDETVVPEEDREIPREPFHGNISIRGAFKKFPSAGCIDISIRNVKENEIEDDLFNKEMIQLFGECKDDILNPETNVKQFMLKDFNILTCDGNFTIATAERDINYLFFCHCY